MSETPGSSGPATPATPAGWYPTGDGWERWWDGNAWSQHHVRQVQQAPTSYAAPYAAPGQYGTAPGQPYYVAPPGSSTGSGARTVLVVVGLVLLLLVGGCVAVVTVTGVAIDNAVEEIEAEDDAPGGADNPLEVTPGEPFTAQGFSYAAGWATGVDAVGDLTITGLTATNTGSETDFLSLDISFLRGTEQLAQASCSASSVAPGDSTELSCYSFDPVPTGYDTVTVRDAF